jgi:hypothetical protein
MKMFLFFLVTVYVSSSFAEYRVFELVIQNQNDKSERIVTSNLDPFQYPGYYDLRQGEIVMYRDTWMCWQDSDHFKKFCPKPLAKSKPSPRKLASP